MENSKIEWTDHTWNPWIGCTKISPGCTHCYAEALNVRWRKGVNWGKGAPRQRTSASNWKQPLKWERAAQIPNMSGQPRPRVFCASLADWLDDEVPIEWLADLLKLIHDTPNLDWLLLTKRPENWSDRLHTVVSQTHDIDVEVSSWLDGDAWPNVWIGTTVENQEYADKRIPELLNIPARVRFLSCEPLLEEVDLTIWFYENKTQRERNILGSGERTPDNRPQRSDMARNAPSGEHHGEVPTGAMHEAVTEDSRTGSSLGLSPLLRRDTGWLDNKSQGRKPTKQSPGQLGVSDHPGTDHSFVAGSETSQPERRAQPIIETHVGAGITNKGAPEGGGVIVEHSKGFRGAGQNDLKDSTRNSLDWCIVGGESGPKSRIFDVDWARSLRDQCKAASVPFFMKQLGANVMGREMDKWVTRIKDKKGGTMAEWPQELRVREFPTAHTHA